MHTYVSRGVDLGGEGLNGYGDEEPPAGRPPIALPPGRTRSIIRPPPIEVMSSFAVQGRVAASLSG